MKKEYFSGTHRVKDPIDTLNLIKTLMPEIGVTEVSDITHLDRLNIPVYSATRPRAARGSVRINAGKGTIPAHAEVSAMMEAIERFSSEYRGEVMDLASYEQIGLTKAVDPADLILPRELEIGEQLHWLPSRDILNDEDIYIPANAVFHPYDPLGMAQQLFRSDTNGLAAGNVIEEAILHGIFEVIERDALSDAENRRSLGRKIIVESGPVKELIDIFEKNGINVHLWYLNGRTGVPTIAAGADDTKTKDPFMLVTGSGTHLNPEIAALRALTEVAQSRASTIKGGKEDPSRRRIADKAGYERLKRINRMWFKDDAKPVSLTSIADKSTDYIDDDIRVTLKELENHCDRVCVCDLSKTQVPVVRVVIPGFEVSYVDHTRKRTKLQSGAHFNTLN
ncbi:YcaO-related McrA-glycine thioamidation protein [Methanochimaera problematica]|uniref:YcaO-related McrA-glycine thioamidation protein n=1 Tax=Methanochimaera problematica TaxID=2609417 RepID=UPI002938D8C6|nr:YcaO-related McrA-glycine thioamidation protein [Methanoplanus sp. FWC-SCC4]